MHADVEAELRDLFVRLARIPSPSGSERGVADAVVEYLRGVGLDPEEDETAAVTGCACGNLLTRIPGRGGRTIAFCAHLDTVPIERPPAVAVEDGVVRTDGESILGADDKAAVAALLLLARDLAAAAPEAAVELLFTPGEEIGLVGAKAFDIGRLSAEVAYVVDSEGAPGTIITGAPTSQSIDAAFTGVAAHAGIDPESGRSAVVAAARAIAAMELGRVDDETTANVGIVQGGSAVNVVPERCLVRAQVRSHDAAKLAARTASMLDAIGIAAAAAGVDVEVDVQEDYRGYAHDPDGEIVRRAAAAAAAAGLEARLVRSGGGSDGNVFNARGLPAVTLGVGFQRLHSPHESIHVERLSQLHAFAHALVRAAETAA